MSKMLVNILYGTSANAKQVEVSEINIEGLKEAINIIDNQLSIVYHILMQSFV